MKTVYYAVTKDPDEPGQILIATTEKSYWDRNRCLDDGAGTDYQAISDAMQGAGTYEYSESVFSAGEDELDAVLAAMADAGFDMAQDPSFTAFLAPGE